MANVCSNYITIQGSPEIIDIIAQDYIGYNKKADEIDFNFGIMSPIPDELLGNDYEWRIENWGTKWDGSFDYYIDISDDEIFMSVETAWNPCDKWTYKLIELCPGVDIYHEYYEGGNAYIGWIQHSENEGPEDYEEVCYNYTIDSYNYWLTVFEKEYESFDWLSEHIDNIFEDEVITKAEADEVLQMIDDNIPLETLIARCIELDIL
jgi:hypothetical protein